MKISIAMATYNGARYLREQLDSLAAQTLKPYELVISDDGSSDATVEIAEQFASESEFLVRIVRNECNLGYPDNFLKAASLCEGEWVAFCDQDDVWLPYKLEVMSKYFSSDVMLVVHSADLVDKNLGKTGKFFPNIKQTIIAGPLQNNPWLTPAGFTQCFSSGLIQSYQWHERPRDFNFPEKMQAHDKWIYFLANSLGGIAYIKDSLALYRRHEVAVTGSYQTTWLNRVKNVRAASGQHYGMLADVASDYVKVLDIIPASHIKNNLQLASAICYYKQLSSNLKLRANIHSNLGAKDRLSAFFILCKSSAYGSAHGKGLGFKALIKDVVALLRS